MELDFETIKLIQDEFQNDFQVPNLSDSMLARRLQEQFHHEILSPNTSRNQSGSSDFLLARSLQEQLKREQNADTSYGDLVYDKKKRNKESTKSLVDPSWEVVDPTPDIHVLFMAFNSKFFWGKLDSVCVSWSKRMKRCAGICSYQGRGGLCHITLSEPLLKLRPRKDLIETLLHEMIHAFLFVTHNNRDRDGHGPEFHKHMYRINQEAGTNITVYHSFHDEVELYLQHWWRCDGPCQKWKPFFGIVRRSMNRAPGPYDRWWGQHSRSCGGTFIKIKSPEPKVKESKKTAKVQKPANDITKYISSSSQTSVKAGSSKVSNSNVHTVSKPNSGLSTSLTIPSKTNNIHGFSNSNKSFVKGATKMNSNTIVVTKKPTTSSQEKKKDSEVIIISPSMNSSTKSSGNSIGPSIDYSVVRNHWINKFSNQNSQPIASNKRKSSETIPVVSKAVKLNDISSQDSLDCDIAPCPVCNISYPIEELNSHLDICLSKPKTESKECIICLKNIHEMEYQKHVNECLEKNFGEDTATHKNTQSNDNIISIEDDNMEVNDVNCSICDNLIAIEDLDEHLKMCRDRTKCPECGKRISSNSYDVHLADCLMKKLDAMNEQFSPEEETICSKTSKSDSIEEKISCLVCGKHVMKSDLYSHLDECVKEVFENEEEQKVVSDDVDDKLYNCPFCLKLVAEIDMSDHIDICLKIGKGDSEAARNKGFLKT